MEVTPKAIFLDMDGTILNHQNQVSIHTKEIIDELRNRGINVFIATGRAFEEIEGIVPPGFQVDGIVASNGMVGYAGHEVIFKHSLSRELVETVIKMARENKVYYELFPYGSPRITLKQDRDYVENEIRDPKPEGVGINEWSSRKDAIKEKINWADEIRGNEFSKFYFFARTKEQINHWKEKLELLKKEIDFTTSISTEYNVELMVANVNKATGIQQMLKHFNLSERETMAIGDSDNDLPMLRLVNYAVAMKNAPDSIKEVTDDVTEFTCDEDGVYHYLKSKLIL
ncbi:Cof-type HAD-IIB family hydrolase [Neobacillus drentensis]|uniref:HAD family hydrolase n=1 Tax=Neobacillus drentensis TaxID=220684 RepID=UPI001F2F3AD0|nr:HAD family hydrolase [Neobacillus drentensis]ULT59332.1 Cof-type HAD-IIB family hydrolase [Neobacillus drentensis]